MDTSERIPEVWERYSSGQRWGFLGVLFVIGVSQSVDQGIVAVLLEPMKAEFQASDAMMGLLNGFAFTSLYALLGLPIARIADRGARKIVVAVSALVWSVMTVACGFAGSFMTLMLARCGVGVGESGAIAPATSLIVEYFPPSQRTMALGIFGAASTVGSLLTYIGGGGISEVYGWRAALIVIGAPGILVALVAWLVLKEPPQIERGAVGEPPREGLVDALKALMRKRSFVLINISMTLFNMLAGGLATWFPAYIIRILHGNMTEVGATWSVLASISSLIGAVGGSWVTDRLARSDVRWLVWVPGYALIAATPGYMYAFYCADTVMFLIVTFFAGFALSASSPALNSALNTICGSERRTTANAVLIMVPSFIGLGFGPLLAGWLSDQFTAWIGPTGLEYAMIVLSVGLLPCGWTLVMAGKTLALDQEA